MTSLELDRYANSIVNANKWPRVSEAHERVDATGDMPTAETFDAGKLAYLGEINKKLLYFGRDLASTNYIIKYAGHFRAIATLLNNLEDYEL